MGNQTDKRLTQACNALSESAQKGMANLWEMMLITHRQARRGHSFLRVHK